MTNKQKYRMILNWLKLKKSESITPEHFDRKVARHIPDFNVAGPVYSALIDFQVRDVREYLARRAEE